MNLIGYSDSEDSGDDAPAVSRPAAKPAPRAAFQKVVDRSNPGKIKLNLPSATHSHTHKDDIESEAPPAKKARMGGAAFGGFNAMLPAPKKPKVEATTADAPSGKRGLGKGLGVGVNLKTGSEPAFQRQRTLDLDDYDEDGNPIKQEARKQEDFRALLNLPAPKTETRVADAPVAVHTDTSQSQPLKFGPQEPARPRFMPKGMGWGKKKKPSAARPATASAQTEARQTSQSLPGALKTEQKPPSKPKVSLFGSVSQEVDTPAKQSVGEYQPLLHGAEQDDEVPNPDSSFQSHQPTVFNAPPPSNDLTNIASELNLSEAERRQLFGRKGQGPDFSSAKFVDFNTDAEYAHNEMLRQQGETVQHNALKSISGTGKNSLRSLINVASTQKDALEEHFASGRRNKKEAGNKYGW